MNLSQYNKLLVYKRPIESKHYYLVKWPVFSKQVFVFEVQGLVLRQRLKQATCNQTMTLSTVISKNTIYFSIPVQCPAIFFK
jgi:hypothetical protein